MKYRLNPEHLLKYIAVPAVVADQHIKLAGSAQQVLLWLPEADRACLMPRSAQKPSGCLPPTADACSTGLRPVILARQGVCRVKPRQP